MSEILHYIGNAEQQDADKLFFSDVFIVSIVSTWYLKTLKTLYTGEPKFFGASVHNCKPACITR